mmetsp:Transcript_20904/g.23644  ORF Transcript_20904/g.23644 Transcript_20904/m.23644 type:complete len:254 (-) Transcript_20904:43-804(-)
MQPRKQAISLTKKESLCVENKKQNGEAMNSSYESSLDQSMDARMQPRKQATLTVGNNESFDKSSILDRSGIDRSMYRNRKSIMPKRFDVDDSDREVQKLKDCGLSKDNIDEIREAFELYENPKNRRVNMRDFCDALFSFGFDDKYPTMYMVMEKICDEYPNGILFEQFVKELNRKLGERSTKREINKIFELFDKKKKGFLSVEDFRLVAKEIGETMSDEAITQLLKDASEKNEDQIGFNEFYELMVRNSEFGV